MSDAEFIDQGEELLRKCRVRRRRSGKINFTALTREAQRLKFPGLAGKAEGPAMQLVRQRATVEDSSSSKEKENCRKGVEGYAYNDLAKKYKVAFKAGANTKPEYFDSYAITPNTLRDLLASPNTGELLSSRIADGRTFADLIKQHKITEKTLRGILDGISRRETKVQKESREAEE